MKFTIHSALLFLVSLFTLAASQVVVQHPDEHPWEPVYLRAYDISDLEAGFVKACQNLKSDHACDWVFIAVLRDESCIPEDYIIRTRRDVENAFSCPLLLEGYSSYPTQDTSVDVLPVKYHLGHVPGIDIPVYILPRDKFHAWEKTHPDFTYGDLFIWEENHEDVYRGYATEYSEYQVHNLEGEGSDQGSFALVAKGTLEGGQTFSVRIKEEGPNFEPIQWEIEVEDASTADESKAAQEDGDDDDDDLEAGGLAGVVIGAAVFGALVGSFIMAICMRKSPSSSSDNRPRKDVEPTESNHE